MVFDFGGPGDVLGRPRDVPGCPWTSHRDVHGRPGDVHGRPRDVWGRPRDVQGRPRDVQGRPQDVPSLSGSCVQVPESDERRALVVYERTSSAGAELSFLGRCRRVAVA